MRINVLRFGSLSLCRVGHFDDLGQSDPILVGDIKVLKPALRLMVGIDW